MPSATYRHPYLDPDVERPMLIPSSAEEGAAPPARAVVSIVKTIRLRKVGNDWWLDLNDGTDERIITGTTYKLPFIARAISIKDDDGYVCFNVWDSEGVVERFVFGVDRAFAVTHVHFGSARTTATDINLHG